MTTIAYDGNILAVDSQQTSNDTVSARVCKLTRLKDGRWMASSGTGHMKYLVCDWLNGDGPKPEFTDKEDFHGLIVDEFGNAFELRDKNLALTPAPMLDGTWAGGNGWVFAQSAMTMGMRAIEAVHHACRFDVYSSAPIHWVRPSDESVVVMVDESA